MQLLCASGSYCRAMDDVATIIHVDFWVSEIPPAHVPKEVIDVFIEKARLNGPKMNIHNIINNLKQ